MERTIRITKTAAPNSYLIDSTFLNNIDLVKPEDSNPVDGHYLIEYACSFSRGSRVIGVCHTERELPKKAYDCAMAIARDYASRNQAEVSDLTEFAQSSLSRTPRDPIPSSCEYKVTVPKNILLEVDRQPSRTPEPRRLRPAGRWEA